MLLSHIQNIPCECKNLKFALKLLNMKLMDGAGLIENNAKKLQMLADPYKCLKNVEIDCHQTAEFLKMP